MRVVDVYVVKKATDGLWWVLDPTGHPIATSTTWRRAYDLADALAHGRTYQ